MTVINISLTEQYIPMVQDILKGITIIITVHLLYYYCSGEKKGTIAFGLMDSLFNNKVIEFILYVVIGYIAYYMIINEVITL